MSERLVWAPQPLTELNGQTGYVTCEASLAEQLLAVGAVHDPQVGALNLPEIDYRAPIRTALERGEYQTTELAAAKPARKRGR